MAETTADVRRDIELTRERMSTTLAQLEQKMNVMQIVKDHPWPALAVAVGAGVLLSGSRADVKAAAATVTATRGAGSRLGTVLDDVVSTLMTGVTEAFHGHVDHLVTELKDALGAPASGRSRPVADRPQPRTTGLGDASSSSGAILSAAAGAGDAGSARDGIGTEISSGRGGPQNSGVEWQAGRAD